MLKKLRFWTPMMVAVLPACSVESRIVGSWDIASAHLLRARVADAVANSPATHEEAEAMVEDFGAMEFSEGEIGTVTPFFETDLSGIAFVDSGLEPVPYAIVSWNVSSDPVQDGDGDSWEEACGVPYAWADSTLSIASEFLLFNREWAIDGAAGGFNLRAQEIVESSPTQRECWVWELELR